MSDLSVSAVYAPLLISAAALLTVVFSFLYLKSLIRRRTEILFIQDRILKEIREEVDGIINAIDETVERDISLIDEREKSMKALLEDIDKRLGVYVRELEKRRAAEDAYAAISSLSLQKKAMLHKNEAAAPPPAEINEASAFPLPRFQVRAEQPPDAPLPEGAPSPESPSQREQIRELVKAGFPHPVIASRLGISIAEVEFAAALQERRQMP